MRHTLFIAALALLLTAALAAPVRAQYMYLDSNGDGVHSSADVMNPNGFPTTVRVFLSTNQNRDGSPAECNTFDGQLTVNGYSVNLRASEPVQYTGFVNNQPSFSFSFGEDIDPLHYTNGFAGPLLLPPGTYLLATLNIVGTTGSPTIEFIDMSSSGRWTSFDTQCSGNDFDNRYKLAGPGGGSDWFDTDGLGASTGGGGGGQPPVLDPIADQTVDEGSLLAFTATASDPENDFLIFTLAPGSPGGASITAGGSFTWTPDETQGGAAHGITVNVTDGASTVGESFLVTVNEANSSPTIAPIDDQTTSEGVTVALRVFATDPDRPFDTFTRSLVTAPPGATLTPTGPQGNFSWTPGEADGPGTYPVIVRVSDGYPGSFDDEDFAIQVDEVNENPVIDPIADQTVNAGALVSFTAIATDPDVPSQELGWSLFVAPLGANIDPSTGLFQWTAPGPGDYPVTIAVTDFAGGLAFEEVTIHVIQLNQPPVLNPIGDRTVDESTFLTFPVTAMDPDLNFLIYSLLPGAPAGAQISSGGGVFSWAVQEDQGGASYPVTIQVSDGSLTDSETITVTVNEVNRAPALTVSQDRTFHEGTAVFDFSAGAAGDSDIPVQTLTWSLGPGAPAGLTLNPSTGRYSWSITESQGPGVYPITVQVSDGVATTSGVFTITVLEVNTAPVITAIADRGTFEFETVTLTAAATDFDIPPSAITFSLEANSVGATITPEGVFSWTPGEVHGPAPHSFTVIATDNGTPPLQATESFSVFVNEVNTVPVLNPVSDMTVLEGTVGTQQLTATDADLPAQSLHFFKQFGPFFMTVSMEGLITVSPGAADAGTYSANVIVSDVSNFSGQDFQIIITDSNNPPTAEAGGPYNGSTTTAVAFDGTSSADPDGDGLTYSWNFGDASSGTGSTPSHLYTAPGTYAVTLTVSDGSLTAQDGTTATIVVEEVDALVFFDRDNRLKLNAGKPSYCLQIQSAGGSFALTNVDLATIVMTSEGTGSVSQIASLSGKSTILDGDMNNDGIQEIRACFGKSDLRALFSNLGGGSHTVTVAVEGNLYTGGKFHGEVVAVVSGISGGALAASISPNPLNPKATLTLSLAKAGTVKVDLFDVQGRLMRTLMDGAAAAGYVDVEIDGTDAAGRKLASGIYYVNIVTAAGRMTKPITILK